MDAAALAAARRAEAREADQRRLLVFAGSRDGGLTAACAALAGADVTPGATELLTTDADGLRAAATGTPFDQPAATIRDPARADRLLGTTREAVVLDCHDGWSPNALGRVAGAVDGGGLLVLVTPPLDEWPDRRDDFDAGLAIPPFTLDDVAGNFRRRLVGTLDHPGVAVVDVDADEVIDDGTLSNAPTRGGRTPTVPRDPAFPAAAYEACLTVDQSRALRALESLRTPAEAVVVEADRGRGKSSAAGLAAGSLAAAGRDVLVTAPDARNAHEVFERASDLLDALGALDADTGSGPNRVVSAADGGRVRFAPPPDAARLAEGPDAEAPDAVVVDEAAALPVALLDRLLAHPSVAFCTTVHGYEGAGRGFSVRFRDHLTESDHRVTDVTLDDPIRYARGDPVESWAFRALLLDARPPVDQVVEGATPETVSLRALDADDLLADEHLLRETFGLLVLAHYRTEPDDLARLLDAPNVSVRALLHEGHVVSVALLAREGGLDAETRAGMYEGGRVRGNMIPDVLTSQLRDERAGEPFGYRVLRIATHHAARSQGLGSHLLQGVRAALSGRDERDGAGANDGDPSGSADWLGVGFGATPDLLRFWRRNGYRTVYLSTSRNETSGEYSAVMLDPLTDRGRDLAARHRGWFLDRTPAVLGDALTDLDPDVVREALRAVGDRPAVDLTEREWRVVVDAADGPGLYTADPTPFRRLAMVALSDDPGDERPLTPREERLLVRKVLQAVPWPTVAGELDYVSPRACMRALGEAYSSLVDRYGTAEAEEMRRRWSDE